ncbi:hypothetical protein CA54_16740 [Symmachiella macrocystis]|uniref:Uncharacterized protein n=1 Tax=Symmachiella macrocystis TaxID=2527985 RepID=A0A5C6BLC6_9PLAN|nr:hypothetical protein [Symmachiella macrocystis]TWU12848.1 hypothetical protein CA54_16740 [Symmachiella macrocystis]
MRAGIWGAVLSLSVVLFGWVMMRAESVSAVIVGPTEGSAGDILILDASGSVGDCFAWQVSPELPGEMPTIEIVDGGRRCVVCSVTGRYTVFLAVSNAAGVSLARWTVDVLDDTGPPVPPGPSPPVPVPPSPPGPAPDRFGIARVAYDAAQLVQSPNRAAESAAIASGLEGVAAAIAAGTLRGDQEILDAVLSSNNQALGASVPLWVGWGQTIGERLRTIYMSGMLKGPGDWAALALEVAGGMKAVK